MTNALFKPKVFMQLQQLQICLAKKSMAFHHAALFFSLIFFLWLLLANAQGRREAKYPQQRLTRGIERLKYHNMDLGTARGYGKRAVDMHNVNNFLLEWIALETRMRNLGIPRNLERDQDAIPE